MRAGDLGFFSGMRACRDPNRASADLGPDPIQFDLVAGKRFGIDFQIARDRYRAGAQLSKPLSIEIGLRHDMRDVLEQRLGQCRRAAPAGEGPVGHAGIDQHQWNPALVHLQHGSRPDLGFGKDG